MKYVLMNLEASRMSFGYNSNANTRYTVEFPTKSVLFGMICCGMGRRGVLDELFDKLRKVKVDAFAMGESNIDTDFQSIGSGWDGFKIQCIDKNGKRDPIDIWEQMIAHKVDGKLPQTSNGKTATTKIFDKDYLINQRFVVVLEVKDDAFAEQIAEALKNPVWQMYIGRRKCVPCGRVFYGMFDSKEEAMDVVNNLNPMYRFTEEEPDEYLDEMNVRDVPTTEFNRYDTYTHRRVYKCECRK